MVNNPRPRERGVKIMTPQPGPSCPVRLSGNFLAIFWLPVCHFMLQHFQEQTSGAAFLFPWICVFLMSGRLAQVLPWGTHQRGQIYGADSMICLLILNRIYHRLRLVIWLLRVTSSFSSLALTARLVFVSSIFVGRVLFTSASFIFVDSASRFVLLRRLMLFCPGGVC